MRGRNGITTLLLVVVALLCLHLLLRESFTRWILPTRQASWIWLSDVSEEDGPLAFYAARVFTLAHPPERAQLTVSADEEALVFLNGVPIGGTRYAGGESIRLYDVLDAVHEGSNRLVVEARSGRGVGGLLLRLLVDMGKGESKEIVTDGQWRLFRGPEESLFDLSIDLAAGEPPRSWGPAPTGRWVLSSSPEPAPTIAELRTLPKALGAERFRLPKGSRRWQRLGKTDRSSPALGQWVVFDFGKEVMAYLALRFPAQVGEQARFVGLMYLGRQPGIPDRSQADTHVVAMPGQRVWLDAKPRRFRYATFVGLVPVSGADAYLVDPVRADAAWPVERPSRGPFGLPLAASGPSLEDEVWRELHRLSRVTIGE